MKESRTNRPARAVGLVLAAALTLTACQPASAPDPTAGSTAFDSADLTFAGSPEDAPDTWAVDLDPTSRFGLHRPLGIEPELRPETHVMASEETAALTAVEITNETTCVSDDPEHPMCEYALTFDELPEGTEKGTVLNAGITPTTPEGLLVRVTAIDGHRVQAVQATLQDALVAGEFWVERAFDLSDLRAAPTLAPGVTLLDATDGVSQSGSAGDDGEARFTFADLPSPVVSGASEGGAAVVVPAFDDLGLPGRLSLDVEPVDGVHLAGTLDFGVGCGLDGGVNGSDVAWVEASCHAWEEASLQVTSTRDGPAATERYTVAVFPLAGFTIPIGPLVLVIVVDVLVTVDLGGNVHVGLNYQATERAEVSGGLRFSLTDGLDHTGAVSTTASSNGAALTQPVSAWALGRAEVRLSAYGVLGFGAGGDATVILSGGPEANPRWTIGANAGVFVRVFLGILGFELSAQIGYSLKEPFEVARWQNAPPVLTVTWPAEGETIALGGFDRPLEASATDPEDGVLPVTWTDLTTGATAFGTGPVALDLGSPGVHTLRVRAEDSAGAATEQTLTVTVAAPDLELSLTALALDGTPLGSIQGAAGESVLVEATIGSGELLTSASCADLSWRATNAIVTPEDCRAVVRLGSPGSAVVAASLTDEHGTSANAEVTFTVTEPEAVAPEFLGIEARGPVGSLAEGVDLYANTPVTLSVALLNSEQAGVTPVYVWTVAVDGGSPVMLPAAGAEGSSSGRTWTPPSVWGHTALFTVVVTDASSGQVLTTRTREIEWTSAPK